MRHQPRMTTFHLDVTLQTLKGTNRVQVTVTERMHDGANRTVMDVSESLKNLWDEQEMMAHLLATHYQDGVEWLTGGARLL